MLLSIPPNVMAIFALLLIGLVIGSFLNVLVDRLPADKSIVYPPSQCDYCKKTLRWYDLIPVVSFTLLSGRCRYCHKRLSLQYPIVEILTGALFVATFLLLPMESIMYHVSSIMYVGNLVYHLFIVACFIVIFFADLKYGIIPDKVVFPAIGISFLYILLNTSYVMQNHLFSALGAFLFFLAIYLITRGRGMGFGDVKLAFLLGLFFGFPNIVYALYLAFLTGAFFSIILIIANRKKMKETIAFGPFLVLSALVLFFLSDKISFVWFLPVDLP